MLYLRATLEHPGKPSDAAHALRLCAAEILAHARRLETTPGEFRSRVALAHGSVVVVHVASDKGAAPC